MPHDTAAGALLADPRLAAVLDTFAARVRAGQPVRWHRLIHDTLGCQLGAGFDLALLTQAHWRLASAGIATHIVSEWLSP